MSDIKLGDIFLVTEADSVTAFWRGIADTRHVLLCSMLASAFNEVPLLRDRFMALASEIAGQHASAASTPPPWWAELPCMTCESPQAADVRHACAQVQELSQLALSPSGVPLNCCRVKTVGAMGVPDTPPAASPPRARRHWY
jgi:hypothetical protein